MIFALKLNDNQIKEILINPLFFGILEQFKLD